MAMGVRCATTWSVDGAGGGGASKRRRTHAEEGVASLLCVFFLQRGATVHVLRGETAGPIHGC